MLGSDTSHLQKPQLILLFPRGASGVLRNKSWLSLSLPLQMQAAPAMAAAGALADYHESRSCIAVASGTAAPKATAGAVICWTPQAAQAGQWPVAEQEQQPLSAMLSKEVLKQGCLCTDDVET